MVAFTVRETVTPFNLNNPRETESAVFATDELTAFDVVAAALRALDRDDLVDEVEADLDLIEKRGHRGPICVTIAADCAEYSYQIEELDDAGDPVEIDEPSIY